MKLPAEILKVANTMAENEFKVYLVGGCVRDLLLNKTPKDWDLATDATPDQVTTIFEHSHYDNDYGTVRIVNDNAENISLAVLEITTFRKDIGYSDGRRPDVVKFSTELADDLSRRDFTINALAYPLLTTSGTFEPTQVIDLHNGLDDLEDKTIRTVGDPVERFNEDALRLVRAVRFAAQLDFSIEPNTLLAISNHFELLQQIAIERITDEFNKLIMTNNPSFGIDLMRRTNLLPVFLPELLESVDVNQNQAHSYTVWEHLLRTCQAAADKNYPLYLRLAALFHDIGKPATVEVSQITNQPTFYQHELVGAKITKIILKRLKYSSELVSQITKLVRWHMFFADPDQITLSAVRRLIANIGPDMIWDLVNLRVCDRIGTGVPKEEPYRLRKFKAMIEEAMRSPTSVKMLKISGHDLIKNFNMKPGPQIGHILNVLLRDVLESPDLNSEEKLSRLVKDYLNLDPIQLAKKSTEAKNYIFDVEQEAINDIRDKHHVK